MYAEGMLHNMRRACAINDIIRDINEKLEEMEGDKEDGE